MCTLRHLFTSCGSTNWFFQSRVHAFHNDFKKRFYNPNQWTIKNRSFSARFSASYDCVFWLVAVSFDWFLCFWYDFGFYFACTIFLCVGSESYKNKICCVVFGPNDTNTHGCISTQCYLSNWFLSRYTVICSC